MINLRAAIIILAVFTCKGVAQDIDRPKSANVNLLGTGLLPDGIAPGPYSLAILLDNPKIIKELALTENQMTKLKAAKKRNIDDINDIVEEIKVKKDQAVDVNDKLAIVQLELEQKQRTERIAKLTDDFMSQKILDRRQDVRIRQIRLQAEGTKAFDREDVRIALDLTPDQIGEIKKISFENVRSFRKAATLPPGIKYTSTEKADSVSNKAFGNAVSKAQSNLVDIRVGSMKSIEKILSDSQRIRYKKMIGEPFDFLGINDKQNDKGQK